MQHFVSDTANYGALTRGPRIIDAGVKARMKTVLAEIQDGTFTREWIDEHEAGDGQFKKLLAANDHHAIEAVGEAVRQHMSWLKR